MYTKCHTLSKSVQETYIFLWCYGDPYLVEVFVPAGLEHDGSVHHAHLAALGVRPRHSLLHLPPNLGPHDGVQFLQPGLWACVCVCVYMCMCALDT